jgi:hypothetical protein
MGPRTGVDTVSKRAWNRTPHHLMVHPVASRHTITTYCPQLLMTYSKVECLFSQESLFTFTEILIFTDFY